MARSLGRSLAAFTVAILALCVTAACTSTAAPDAADPTVVQVEADAARAVETEFDSCIASTIAFPEALGAWQHPTESFYAVDDPEIPTADDLAHLLLHDAAIVVSYSTDLPPADQDALREWSYSTVAAIVVPQADVKTPVVAATAEMRLDCEAVSTSDLDSLAALRDASDVTFHEEGGG